MDKKRFSQDELGGFFLGLAHLIRAGLSFGDALNLLAEDQESGARKELFCRMAELADSGLPLSEVLTTHNAFPPYAGAMVSAGEETGRVEESLFALSEYYEGQARLERQLRAALLHPLMLMGVLLAVLIALLGWVLPVFDDVYRQLGSSLTGVAGVLLTIGKFIRRGAPVLLPLAAAMIAAAAWLFSSAKGRETLSRFVEKMGSFPLQDSARLTQVLSMGISSGLTEERAVELASALFPETSDTGKKCKNCLDMLRNAHTLSAALRDAELLPPSDCRLLEAGIRSGNTDTVMARLAKTVSERSEAQLEARVSRLEPAIVLTASLLVGLVLLSVLLPLTRIMSGIG